MNPGDNIIGYAYAAKLHTDATHQLPLPPNAIGECNFGLLYQEVLNFIKASSNLLSSENYPPLFTRKDQIDEVKSILNDLMERRQCTTKLKVYNINYLFYNLKKATCTHGGLDIPKSIFITDSYFDRDEFEYSTGIGCSVSIFL